jgi:hypothetical protein
MSKLLTFNVGGELFTVTETTVANSPVLIGMVKGVEGVEGVTQDQNGLPYVEGSPQAFSGVLHFLRWRAVPNTFGIPELEVSVMTATFKRLE